VKYKYQAGATFERRVKSYFESNDYVVFRSAGSRSPADLICLKAGEVILVQCKISGRLTPLEKQKLMILKDELNCQVAIFSRNGRELVREDL